MISIANPERYERYEWTVAEDSPPDAQPWELVGVYSFDVADPYLWALPRATPDDQAALLATIAETLTGIRISLSDIAARMPRQP